MSPFRTMSVFAEALRRRTLTTTSLVLAAILTACSSAGPADAGETSMCTPLEELISGASGGVQAAVTEHEASPDELKRAALFWAVAVQAANGVDVGDETLVALSLAELPDVPSLYPSLASACPGRDGAGMMAAPLIASPDDFACANSCFPSPALLEKLIDKTAEKIVIAGGVGTVFGAQTAEAAENLRNSLLAGSEYSEALKVLSNEKAGSIAASVASAIETTANLAKGILGSTRARTVALLAGAFQVGWEFGSALELAHACSEWKYTHCCAPGFTACGLPTAGSVTCCLPGQLCTDAAAQTCRQCEVGQAECGSGCCPEGEKCVDLLNETCSRCDQGQAVCGQACCAAGQRCADASTGRCEACEVGHDACGATCCPIGSLCRDAEAGRCARCADGQAECGSICCPSGQTCADAAAGRCAPCGQGQSACGSGCCPDGQCQDGVCQACGGCGADSKCLVCPWGVQGCTPNDGFCCPDDRLWCRPSQGTCVDNGEGNGHQCCGSGRADSPCSPP